MTSVFLSINRYLHETGLALVFGLIMGAVIRYGVTDLGQDPTSMKVKARGNQEAYNSTRY